MGFALSFGKSLALAAVGLVALVGPSLAELPVKVPSVDGIALHTAKWYPVQAEKIAQKFYIDLNSFKATTVPNSALGVEGVVVSAIVYVDMGKNEPVIEMMVATFSCSENLVSISPFHIISEKTKPSPDQSVKIGSAFWLMEGLACGTLKVKP